MEPLGKKLQQARLARKITLEEASRVTKIRPSRIEEIEQEDFSSFASLAYAKGFLLIYGKFLDVDVTPYLEAFEISDRVTVDGYSYLQDNSGTGPPPIVRRQRQKRTALLPLIVAVVVLVVGLYLIKLFLDIQRIAPPRANAAGALPTASESAPAATAAPGNIIAPRAVPVEGSPPAGETAVEPKPSTPASPEPEVRRAQPVHPEDLASPPPNVIEGAVNRVQITPVRKTFVRVILDRDPLHPAFEGWLTPADPPLSFRARQVVVKALERGAIEVTKNGAPVAAGDAGVSFE